MIEFTQDNINKLTDYILNNEALSQLAIREEWIELILKLASDERVKILLESTFSRTRDGFYGFLYQYFLKLDNFNLLNEMKDIPSLGFRGLDLKKITIPGNVKDIHMEAFASSYLESVIIEEGVVNIYSGAFSFCHKLNSINLPRSLEYIGRLAFENCGQLRNINYNGTRDDWKAIQKDRPLFFKTSSITIKCTDGDIKKK